MRHEVGRLFDHLAVAPDTVTRHIGTDVEIGAEQGNMRAAGIGHADDRTGFWVELAESVKGAGILLRHDGEVALHATVGDSGGAAAPAGAKIQPGLQARKTPYFATILLHCRRNSHLSHLPNISTNAVKPSHDIKSN